MGQRTQMLLKVHILDTESSKKETVYLNYHYQWGFGKVMPMAFLNLATHLAMTTKCEADSFQEATKYFPKIADTYCSVQNEGINLTNELPDDDDETKEYEFKNPHKAGFDNNNGWLCAELDVIFMYEHFYLRKGKVKFYRGIEEATKRFPLGSPMSIESWQSEFQEFCSKKWLTGYKNLLSSYNIDFPYTPNKKGETK
ncbi:unnamed protein product [Fructobacillus fructosus]|uniref:hypothetical protein n=1 Tax=Fructobacillus fructosus TaxID=1631 RepID=UPI002DA2FC05|nr:unnamed protein product [Fructobacillus fructosus]